MDLKKPDDNYQIIKGWIPASQLDKVTADLNVYDLKSLGGESAEGVDWQNGVFENGVRV